MVIDKIKKFNSAEPDGKNIAASDMLVGKWVKCSNCKDTGGKSFLRERRNSDH